MFQKLNRNNGFSLIELMIVIAIAGILTAIAIPTYNIYIKKARMANVVNLLGNFKTEVQLSYNNTGTFPDSVNDCTAGNIISYSDDIGSFHWNHDSTRGWIQFLLISELGGGRIQMQGVKDADNKLVWYCGFWNSDPIFIGINGESQSYAPSNCSRTDLENIS